MVIIEHIDSLPNQYTNLSLGSIPLCLEYFVTCSDTIISKPKIWYDTLPNKLILNNNSESIHYTI